MRVNDVLAHDFQFRVNDVVAFATYLLEWGSNSEADVFEYIVYRDGEKLPMSPRGGTFYVDVDVGGTHAYSISALTLSGNEGPRCSEVSTASAQNGWGDPAPPGRLRILP